MSIASEALEFHNSLMIQGLCNRLLKTKKEIEDQKNNGDIKGQKTSEIKARGLEKKLRKLGFEL